MIQSAPKKILVVDDEPDIIFVIRFALESKGYQVEEASDGLMGLQMIGEKNPDAIILDIMMPKLDGQSVNLRLKENPQTANIPVIVITGRGQLRDLIEMKKEMKVAAYLEKPFRVDNLVDTLGDILGP